MPIWYYVNADMDMLPLIKFLELQIEQEARKKEIGTQIRQMRNSIGETQSAAASGIGVTQAYLSHIESGNKTPSQETMISIVNYFTERSQDGPDEDQD